jgi:hypothetical protein
MTPRRTAQKLVLFLVLLVGCGGEPGAGEPDEQPPAPDLAFAIAPDCPQTRQGSGAVWLDDPAVLSLIEHPLYCMDGSGRLQGTFVSAIQPDGWQPAQQGDLRFVYPLGDPHQHEVQIYHALTGMAARYRGVAGAPAPIRVTLSADASFTLSRYDHPDRLRIALQGVVPQMVPGQILHHEYGHHLILRYGPLEDVVNEAFADYLAADFSGEPRILELSRLALPASVKQDSAALEVARRYLERSVENQRVYPTDVVTQEKLCQILAQAAAVFPAGSPLVPAQKLADCASASKQELARPEPHRTGMIASGALWSLRGQIGPGAVAALLFQALTEGPHLSLESLCPALKRADLALTGGRDGQAIEAVCTARGLPR